MDVTFWLHLLYYALLLLVGVASIAIAMLGLPGLWLLVIAAGIYAIATGGTAFAWPGLATLVVLGLVAEGLEFLAGVEGSRRSGGGWRGITGAIVGGIVGGIVGVPIPVVGPLVGAVLGAGVGAALLEFSGHNDAARASQIGYGAAKGRMWGILIKGSIGVIMLVVVALAGFPLELRAPDTPPALPTPLPIESAEG